MCFPCGVGGDPAKLIQLLGGDLFDGDIDPVVVDALKAIRHLGREELGRFRPYGGSHNWTAKVEGTGEKDRDKWQILAVSDAPADYVQAEAECVAAGGHTSMPSPIGGNKSAWAWK